METVCCLVLTTTGTQGENLGSDETDIVLLGYTLINVARNQVLGIQEYVVLPKEAEASSNFLSDDVRECTRLTEAAVRTSGVSLEKAIQLFGNFCSSLGVSPYSTTFITDGQLPLRQCLHPESVKKNLHLPAYYNAFADLRKSVVRFYQTDSVFTSISDILTFLDIPNADDTSFFCKELRDMVNIVQRVISDGHKFISDETIQISLEPGICSKDEEVDSATVVRARGLPWQSSDQDIAKFFRGLNLAKGGVALCLSPMGRRNGEALVRFSCAEHREMALRRHKHHISTRYIEVYRATGEDFVNVAGGSSNEAQAFLTKGAQVIIRMRGLPYDCTAKQVMEFFAGGEDGGCEVMGAEEGVLFVRRPDGRSTGDAFVLFRREEDAPKALSRHRQSIGVRYIELFRSTTAEVQQVLNRTLEESASSSANSSTTAGGGSVQLPLAPLPPILAQLPLLPQHIITSGTSKDCIRLRGLPYEAQVEHILEFLGEHAKHILFQGVHMVFNSQGQPSGEAFIQMDSEASAASAAQLRHHKNMVFGKKQRYIEVWQCSGEDMSLVLSGASGEQASPQALPQPPPTPVSPPQTQQAGDYGMRWRNDTAYLMSRIVSGYPQQHGVYWPYIHGTSPPPLSPPPTPQLIVMPILPNGGHPYHPPPAHFQLDGWGMEWLNPAGPLHTAC